jgi:hypothetical protein
VLELWPEVDCIPSLLTCYRVLGVHLRELTRELDLGFAWPKTTRFTSTVAATGAPDVLVLAGYIAPARVWIDFSNDWKERLDHARMPFFKMNEMAQSPERLERAAWFYRTIEEHEIAAAISCVVRTSDLVRIVRSIEWPSYMRDTDAFENPYYFAFRAIIDCLAQHQERLKLDEPIDFVFDEDGEKKHTLKYFDRMKWFSSPQIKRLLGNRPIYRNDSTTPQLQAADLYAWWIRKWELDGVKDAVEKLPFPWTVRKQIPRLNMEFSEVDFRIEFEKYLTPDALERALIKNETELLEWQKRKAGFAMTLPDPSSPFSWPASQ